MSNKDETVSGDMVTLCGFWLDGRLFGVNILDVREINSETAFTPISHTPESVRGYVNIRGQIYLIGDMRRLMGFPGRDPDEKSSLIILKDSVAESFGLLVDGIDDVVTVPEEAIVDRRNTQRSQVDFSDRRRDGTNVGLGVCKLEDRLMVVINSRNLLKKIAIDIDSE